MSGGHPTPGPWRAGALRERGRRPGVDVIAADGLCVARVRHEPAAYDRGETLANARLIAAAPALLAAARNALHYQRLHRYADGAWADDLAAAIAEAEGRA